MTKDVAASCPILERILHATPPGISQRLIREYQTRILLNMMDHLQKGSEDIMVVFKEGVLGLNVERSLCGLSVFCSSCLTSASSGTPATLGASQSVLI